MKIFRLSAGVLLGASMLAGFTAPASAATSQEWTGSELAWAYVNRAFPATSFWNLPDRDAPAGTYDGGATVQRSFFRMDTSGVAGRHVLRATLRLPEKYSYSCTARRVDLWLTGPISATTTWSNQPAFVTDASAVTAAKGYSAACPAGDLEFDVTAVVADQAAAGATDITLGLRAFSETDSFGWKRFANSPQLVVEYE